MKMKTNKQKYPVHGGEWQRWEEFCEFKASLIYTDFQASKTLL